MVSFQISYPNSRSLRYLKKSEVVFSMWCNWHPKSLKNKLIASFILVSIIPTIAISLIHFKSSHDVLEKNMAEAAENALNYSLTLVEKQLNQAEQLSDWFFFNSDLDTILTKSELEKEIRYDPKINSFLDLVEFQLALIPRSILLAAVSKATLVEK
jgi:nitrogen fixation/metabolism regulation signal transduction histidine kinase